MSGPSAEGPTPAPSGAAEAGPVLGEEAWTRLHDALYYASQADGVSSGPATHTEAEHLVAAVEPIVVALVAAAEKRGNDERAELYRSISEMEAKHRAACASWERRLREQVAAAEERGAAAERERCAITVAEIDARMWGTHYAVAGQALAAATEAIMGRFS